MIIRNDNNRNPMSKHRHTMNYMRMPFLGCFANWNIFWPRYSNWPDRLESSRSRTLHPFIFTNSLSHDPSRGKTSHPQCLPNDCDTLSTLKAKPCPAPPRRRYHSVCFGNGWAKIVSVRRTSESCRKTPNCPHSNSALTRYFPWWIGHAPI
jgi:hypothetical protein